MITLVGRWEDGWLDPKVELFMFRQLKGAFKFDRLVMVPKLLGPRTNVDQYDTMEEALASCDGKKVFLEPSGTTYLEDCPTEGNLVFVFGNALKCNQEHITEDDLKVRINTKGKTDMFAVNAASIVLNYLK